MKLTKGLMEKVDRTFAGKAMVLTGQGLGRKELRVLERQGIIESKLFKHKEKGMVIRGWKLIKSGFIKEKEIDIIK